MNLTRSQFLRLCGAGLGALGLGKLVACDGSEARTPDAPPIDPPPADAPPADSPAPDGPTADAPPGICTQGTMIVIGFNHGHEMTVTPAEIAAGVPKTYQIQGTSDHPHTVPVTAAMFATLRQGAMVTVVSSTDDGHPHTVTIRCA